MNTLAKLFRFLNLFYTVRRIRFEIGKRFRGGDVYVPSGRGYEVKARRTKTNPVTHVPYYDLFAGGAYRLEELSQEEPVTGAPTVNLEEIHKKYQGESVTPFILDTGIDHNHEDLQGKINLDLCRGFVGDPKNFFDGNGHGTHVAGIIGANKGNGKGIYGVAPKVTIVALKVLSDSGSGSYQGIMDAIDYAIALVKSGKVKGPVVMNMSLGGPNYQPLIDKVKEANDVGIHSYNAAGNAGGRGGQNTISCPGNASDQTNSRCGASCNKNKKRSWFSSVGKELTGTSFGEEILSLFPGNKYKVLSGTSMATPWYAGIGCLALSCGVALGISEQLTPEVLRKLEQDTAEDMESVGFDDLTGWGLAYPTALIAKIEAMKR